MANSRGHMGRPGKSKEQKLEKELATLQSRYDNARELLDKPGGMDTSTYGGCWTTSIAN
jgi:hypothetical protein